MPFWHGVESLKRVRVIGVVERQRVHAANSKSFCTYIQIKENDIQLISNGFASTVNSFLEFLPMKSRMVGSNFPCYSGKMSYVLMTTKFDTDQETVKDNSKMT